MNSCSGTVPPTYKAGRLVQSHKMVDGACQPCLVVDPSVMRGSGKRLIPDKGDRTGSQSGTNPTNVPALCLCAALVQARSTCKCSHHHR